MKKKYYVMFEMFNSINFASRVFESVEEARRFLEFMRKCNDPFVVRAAVGFWEKIPCENGVLKIFNICSEFHRISK